MDLYIYYRVACDNEREFQLRVTAMQSALTARYQIAAALKRRPVPQDGWHTWMEVYLAVPPAFESDLAAAVTAAGLAELIDGKRHIEHFLEIHACA